MTKKYNARLLCALKQRGLTQRAFAKAVGDHEVFISRVINGWINIDEDRKARYATVLGQKKEDLFND